MHVCVLLACPAPEDRAFGDQGSNLADVNGDGSVNLPDLVQLIMDWGTCDDCCLSALDLNGVVNVVNLIALILNWG